MFCAACWTLRGKSCVSVLSNHDEPRNLWAWSLKKRRLKVYFLCLLGALVFKSLKSCQNPILSATERIELAKNNIWALEKDKPRKRI